MDQADVPGLLSRLASDEDGTRKMAVFKLQSSINDPAFADIFISSGGLASLRRLIMGTGGNTLAYSLQSLARLLEVDMGWDIFENHQAGDLVERVVELVVTNPLVNILRGAMSILVALVGHSQSTARGAPPRTPGSFGFRALKPAVAVHSQFFELVIQQLQSADHALCANALMLVNALIRDAISSESGAPTLIPVKGTWVHEDWPKFIKRLQDLGLIKAVYAIMQSSSLQDLAHPLLEFQSLTKILLRKWREVRVDLERPEHRRGLKGIHLSSAPQRSNMKDEVKENQDSTKIDGRKAAGQHNPEKWRRLGFETESPAQDFDVTGFLGMMDLTDYVRKNEDEFQKLLLEQSTRPLHERCPIARASLAVTLALYDHFEIEKSDLEDAKGYHGLDGAKHYDKLLRPLLLQWSRLHTAGLHAFFRIWKATGAEQNDLEKVVDLTRILIDRIVGQAARIEDVAEVEEDLQEFDVAKLRDLQMELLEMTFENHWGQHLYQVREELRQEALQFVKEQRIRCLLEGSWFTKPTPRRDQHPNADGEPDNGGRRRLYTPTPWRYAKLSPNRRFLHYADFEDQPDLEPSLDSLHETIDLGTISSVVSNVSVPNDDVPNNSSTATLKIASTSQARRPTTAPAPVKGTTKITIYSYAAGRASAGAGEHGAGQPREEAILVLFPLNHSLASEWLDGLLMLLNQAPITSETSKLVNLVREYGLKIRLLNVRLETAYTGPPPGAGIVPSREGLDEDYHYEI